MNFQDLNFSRKILKTVSFFPTLITKDDMVVGIDLQGEGEVVDVVIDLMEEYGIPMGILFTKDKKINVVVRFEDEINIFDLKKEEISEVITISEVEYVIIMEEIEDNGVVIISNRYIKMEEGNE